MPIVKEWKAAYYQNSKSKWLYGTLSVYPAFIRFVEQYNGDGGGNSADFRIYYDEFTELKKEKTTVFYTAITVRVKEEKYWFSSLQSCTAAFNIIEHFWRERLIDRFAKFLYDLSILKIVLCCPFYLILEFQLQQITINIKSKRRNIKCDFYQIFLKYTAISLQKMSVEGDTCIYPMH